MSSAKQYKQYEIFFDKNITPESKKYSVHVADGKLIHFGQRNMQHWHDSTGVNKWSHLNHNDLNRKKSYLARAKGIKNAKGEATYLDKNTPNYYSVKYLWGG
jgi:hypothetical protein